MRVKLSEIRSVPDNVRKAREHRNYSQDYLAYKLGISQNAYSKVELGYTSMTVQRLIEIAVILNIDMATLLDISPKTIDVIAGDLNLPLS